jgi:hypothetical protein
MPFVTALSSPPPAGRSSRPISFSNWTQGVSGYALDNGNLQRLTPPTRKPDPDSPMGGRHHSANPLFLARLCTRLHGHLASSPQGPLQLHQRPLSAAPLPLARDHTWY